MGAVFDEFQRELAELRRACADNPRREMLQLFLLALEREELVSVGYRASLMEARLASMTIPDEVREVIRHLLVWIWQDEEMHTIYIRGALLKIGGFRLRCQALLSQLAGGLGGWAGSVMQHTRWSRAPLSRLLATAITAAGSLTGKVPADVKQHLQFGPFRNFCRFNVDAEKTAAVCWYRIVELTGTQPEMQASLGRDFLRVAQDEDRHSILFQLLADSLTDDDRLADGVTVEELVAKVRAVGEEFLPRSFRTRSDLDNPIGSGQPVYVVQSANAADKRRQFRELLEICQLGEALRNRAAHLGRPLEQMRIGIKPTFMLGYHRKDPSPITDVELIEDLTDFLHAAGCREIAIIEGRNIYDRFFQNRTVPAVANYFGISSERFRIVDTADEQTEHRYGRGMGQYTIAQSWRDADFRISFPKVRSHPIELALLSLGNVEWVGGRCDEYLFLERQADRTTANMMLLDEFPPHFAILDGFENVPDGMVGVMGCRRPKSPRRFYAGADALAVDTIALQHLGVVELPDGGVLRAAAHWFGGAPKSISVVGETTPIHGWRGPYSNELWALLSMLAYPVYVLGSGRGELFVPEMDEQAFPFIQRESFFLNLRRRAVRHLLGLHIPYRKSRPPCTS